MHHRILLTLPAILASLLQAKPTIWVYSDLSDPTDQRAGGHPQNDPDDICTLAALLLEANRFDIAAVVFSSNLRKGLRDATPFVGETFATAYAQARPPLNEALGGFQDSIPFLRSSLHAGGDPVRFDPAADYRDLSGLPTVAGLVDLASEKAVYVLNWGPLTESAIAVRHCISTGNQRALDNLTIISHWTKSYIAQGTPDKPFAVANCRDDSAACDYLHGIAATTGTVRFIETGSVGQTGIVNGGGGYPDFAAFESSALGQVFIKAKFYHGKPDYSDGATFWLLTELLAETRRLYPLDGRLDQPTEERARDLMLAKGHAILDDLLERSRIAAAGGVFSPAFIAARFTYVYRYLDGRYQAHVPYDAELIMTDAAGVVVRRLQLRPGNHELDMRDLPPGIYSVEVAGREFTRSFQLEKTP